MTAQRRPIPSAGPYYIVSSSRDQWCSHATRTTRGHRPRIPERIVYSFGVGLPPRGQAGRGRPQRLPRCELVFHGANSADAPALLQRSNGATAPPAPRHEPATSGTSSTRGFTWITSSSTPPVRVFASSRLVAPSTTRSTAARSCSTTSSSTAGGRPTTTSYRESRAPVRSTSIRWAVPTSPRPARLAAGVHAHATFTITRRRTATAWRTPDRQDRPRRDRDHGRDHPALGRQALSPPENAGRPMGHRVDELGRRLRRPVHDDQRAV